MRIPRAGTVQSHQAAQFAELQAARAGSMDHHWTTAATGEFNLESGSRSGGTSKIRIVIEGLRGDLTVAALCRREGINQNSYYKWSKEFLEAGKHRLAGDTQRQATSEEVKELWKDLDQLTCACGPVQASSWRRSCP